MTGVGPNPVRIVELRIHGVSGTPPESMLQWDIDRPLKPTDVEQVAGDDLTGFYRRKAQVIPEDPRHLVEAYNWGQLTSGNWKKALWLLLVPFGLLNAAHFMLPKAVRTSSGAGSSGPVGKGVNILCEALLRILGLIMTVAFTIGAAEALVDLVGWQWTGLTGSGTGAVGPRYADPRGWLAGALVLAGLIPMVMLWFGGGRSPSAGQPVAPVADPPNGLAGFTEMTGPEFGVGLPTIGALLRIHLATVGALLAQLGFSIYHLYGGPTSGLGRWLADNGTTVCTWMLMALLAQVVLLGNPHRAKQEWWTPLLESLSWLFVLGSAAVWLAACVTVLNSRLIPSKGRGPLPGMPGVAYATMLFGLAAIVLFAVLAALLAALSHDAMVPRPFRRYLWGLVSTVMATVGVFLGVGFSAATVFGTRYVLLRTAAAGSTLTPPLIYTRIAHAWGLVALEIVVIVGIMVVIWRLQHSGFAERVRIAHNIHPYQNVATNGAEPYSGLKHPDDLTPAVIAGLATSWWLARVKYHLQWIFLGFAAFGLLLTVMTAISSAVDNQHYWWEVFRANAATTCLDEHAPANLKLIGWTVSCTNYGGPFLVSAGSLVLLGLAIVLVYLGRKAVSDNGVRRGVNVVWDVIAFWPRAAHPLVPPPYAAKALDELRRRIYFHLGLCAMPGWHASDADCTCAKSSDPVERVLLAPHSQGSLLAIAAIAGLRAEKSPPVDTSVRRPIRFDQLGMITYGSQLQFAYSRAFPAYVNHALIKNCLELLSGDAGSRWISLLRETDPVGGQVFSDRRRNNFTSRSIADGFVQYAPDTRSGGIGGSEGVRISGAVEWRLLDPVPTDAQHTKRWPVLAHGGYFLDPVWTEVVAEVARRS